MVKFFSMMIYINHNIRIPDKDLVIKFILSSGPGGQNVNKTATAVQLRYHARSADLPENVKLRLLKETGKKITSEGDLVITARRYRSQEQNRQDAIERLKKIIVKAAAKPLKRRKTRPTTSSKEKRLKDKKHRSDIKRLRKTTI